MLPRSLRDRYIFAEVRNAAAALAGTNPAEYQHIVDVLEAFWLTSDSLTAAGGNKSAIAADLDLAFRHLGWREAGHVSKTLFTLKFSAYPSGTKPLPPIEYVYETSGHKVDNFLGRVALDVEWNAKDGNLDRDLANFRALHDADMIDAAVLITRHHERTKWAANRLAEEANKIRKNAAGQRIVLLDTATTTNMEKLVPRLRRGDAGGCPVLAIGFTELCYKPSPGEPVLPPFPGAYVANVPDPARDPGVVSDEPEPDDT